MDTLRRNKTYLLLRVVAAWAFIAPVHAQYIQVGQKLTGAFALGNASQGFSVAGSADGHTALVGGRDDNGGAGATWAWVRIGGAWFQQAKLVATDYVGLSEQGQSVALSADGNTALIGGIEDSGLGAAWVWVRNGSGWTQQGPKLVGSGASSNPAVYQGWAVALSADGNTALIGGPGDNFIGAAWVWTRNSGVWTQQGPKLVASDGVASGQQGDAVALSADGNTALIGGGADGNTGAVWVWTRSGGVWTQQGPKLVGTGAVGNARQGQAVALSADGNTAVVSGPADNNNTGAAWVWVRSGAVWTQQGPKLTIPGEIVSGGAGSISLSGDGNTALIGGDADNNQVGSAWVWKRSGSVWTAQGSKLLGTSGIGQSRQGQGVALSADASTAVIGGPGDNNLTGAFWVFGVVGGPVVTLDPLDAIVQLNGPASFTAAATASSTPTVQWQVSTDGGVTFSNVPGAVSTTLNVTAAFSANGYRYRAVFTNAVGTATSNSASLTVLYPFVTIQKTHTGNFTQGLTGTWTINVLNTGSASNLGYPVTVTDDLPPGYTLSSYTGTHWSCSGTTAITCTSSDTIAAGQSYPTITLVVNVPVTSPLTVLNTAYASGGLFVNQATSTDTVTVNPFGPANNPFIQLGPKLVTTGALYQGSAVALSGDGNTALIAAGQESGGAGPAVWNRIGAGWVQGTTLIGGSGQQGVSVALSVDGNTALVGSEVGETAFAWTRTGGSWTLQGVLSGLGAVGSSGQGYAVALSADGNTALIGGRSDNNGTGAAWVWIRSNGSWQQQSKLVGTGGTAPSAQGSSVALSGDGNTALIGGPQDANSTGAVWVWTRSGGVWAQQGSKLVAPGPVNSGASQGWSVALSADGNTAAVGSLQDSVSTGAVWIWTRTGSDWALQSPKLVGTFAAGPARQGASVALSADGNVAVSGGTWDNNHTGALWVWTRSGGIWTQAGPKLTATGEVGGAELGHSAAISADGTLILASGSLDNNSVGAVWVFGVASLPQVTQNPTGQFADGGSGVLFNAFATGTPAPTVQWQVSTDGGATFTDIPGATSIVYGFTVTGVEENNLYRAVFTNPLGSVASTAAILAAYVPHLSIQVTHTGTFMRGQSNASYQLVVSNDPTSETTFGEVTVVETVPSGLSLVSMSGAGWTCPGTAANNCTRADVLFGRSTYPPITIVVSVSAFAASPQVNVASVSGGGSRSATASDSTVIEGALPVGLGFFPMAPCRVADTRVGQGKTGSFGPPGLIPYSGRDLPFLSTGCGLPASAQAYSLNFTAIPTASLDFFSTWPSGQSFPGVSTLNSPDGSTIANAAIVPAGVNNEVTVLAGKPTDLIIDSNGYFAPPDGRELAFYPIRPCRAVDTRADQGKSGAFGPPALKSYVNRDFPIVSSGCGIPVSASAYSLNMTVVPGGGLDFLSTWPAGQSYPGVSTLNSADGSVIANAAVVPAGVTGGITVLASDETDLIIDANGYFAPPGSPGALHFYPLTPCRVVDTRGLQGKSGAFGPPMLAAYSNRDFPILSGGCGVPSLAQAYSLNITAVPQGHLDFLSVWPAGQGYPGVSTLNSPKGTVIANAAIVPAGLNGAITVAAGNATDLIVDINGYFAP